MQILRPHYRSTEQKLWGIGLSNLYFYKPSGDSDVLEFEESCIRKQDSSWINSPEHV